MGEYICLSWIGNELKSYELMCKKIFLPQYINNIRFVKKEPEHIKSVIEYASHFKPPYNLDGSIFIDFMNYIIHDKQNYFAVGEMSGTAMKLEIYQYEQEMRFIKNKKVRRTEIFNLSRPSLECVRFKELYDEGIIKRAVIARAEGDKIIDVSGKKFRDLIDIIMFYDNLKFIIDMSPFKIKKS